MMTPTNVSDPRQQKRSFLELAITFLALFLVTHYALQYFFPQTLGGKNTVPAPLEMMVASARVSEGNAPVVTIKNNTDAPLPLIRRCPQPPFDVAFIKSDGTSEVLIANTTALPCSTPSSVLARSTLKVDLAPWKYSLFGQRGTYELSLEAPESFVASGALLPVTTKFSLVEPNPFTKLFRAFVTKPLFNTLIWIGSLTPGHNLGVAIILLTILVKLVLLVPNQHALEGQKKLQQLQPKLDAVKKKFPEDPRKVQEETMRLWKEFNINPLQSCLPTLLQFPILIGLFFVVQEGAAIETSRHLLYSHFVEQPVLLDHMFLSLDLLKPSWIFPPLLVVMQFIQMKMMFAKQKKKKAEVAQVDGKAPAQPFVLDQQTIMLYVLPLMIGFFAITFPAAVSLYWAVSTLFGIAQQEYVNREKIKLTPA